MFNRRKSVIVNKQFQYQYSLLVVALTVLLINIAILIQAFMPTEEPLIMTNEMAWGLGAIEFLLITGVWYGSLRATHKIAGPVYVFAREAGKLGEGNLTAAIKLRKNDMFQEEADSMNASFAALRTRVARVKTIAKQLEAEHAGQPEIQRLLSALHKELAAFKTEERSDEAAYVHEEKGGEEQCLVQS
mgnify:FL=1